MTDLRRYEIQVNHKTLPAEHGFSADSTLKIVEQALREGATHINVWDVNMSMLSKFKPWR